LNEFDDLQSDHSLYHVPPADFVSAPMVISPAVAIAAAVGQPASISVLAAGPAPLAYHCFKIGLPLASATDASSARPSFKSAEAGTDPVVVTNAAGSVTSTTAALFVTNSRLINFSILKTIAAPGDTFTLPYLVGGAATVTTLYNQMPAAPPIALAPWQTRPFSVVPTEVNVDGWIGCSRKLNEKIRWSAQLNVRNLRVGNRLIPVSAPPDGTYDSLRIAEPPTWQLTTSFEFSSHSCRENVVRENFSGSVSRMHVKRFLLCSGLVWGIALAASAQSGTGAVTLAKDATTGVDWVTVAPPEFPGAINNPLKGFRDYQPDGYGLLQRIYMPWNAIEVGADDSVDRIIAHTNKITQIKGRRFEELNVKLVPRVYLDWNGTSGRQHWPADLQTFDYDSPAFHDRLRRLVAKLGEAWDNDPRIFAVQMGLIGYWGEHHTPAPTSEQRQLLTEAFRQAFKNKPVLVRQTNPEFMEAGFGIYYDTFATLSREPPTKAEDQFPWQATHVYPEIWKRAPIEGEVEYNWQKQRLEADPENTFGRTPDETMKVPAYRHYMIDKIRRYHSSYQGWISGYNATDATVLAGAAELQKAFGYRFVIDSLSYPLALQPGGNLTLKLSVRNTGSAPFYLDWPVAVALLDPKTRRPVWSAPLSGVDLRRWLPGEDWDSATSVYRRPAQPHHAAGEATLPNDLTPGDYILALAILDRQGGMNPSARFAVTNYFRGGWHPFGFIGVGKIPQETALKNIAFDSPAFDPSLSYRVPAKLLAVQPPPLPEVKALPRWSSDPKQELINPWRYWILDARSKNVEKQVSTDGPVESPAGRRVLSVVGDFGQGSSLKHTFFNAGKLKPGRYRFACRVRGTAIQPVLFEVADGSRAIAPGTTMPLATEWQEYVVEFEVKSPFKEETSLRFVLPKGATGEFSLTDTHLRELD